MSTNSLVEGFNKRVAEFCKETPAAAVEEKEKTGGQRFISEPGVVELIYKGYEKKGDILKINFENDNGEKYGHSIFLSKKENGISTPYFLATFIVTKMLGVTIPRNGMALEHAFPEILNLLNLTISARVKVKLYWPKDTYHSKYISKGTYHLENDKGEILEENGAPVEITSGAEGANVCLEYGKAYNGFLRGEILDIVKTAEFKEEPQQAQKKPVAPAIQPPSVKTWQAPKPVTDDQDGAPF